MEADVVDIISPLESLVIMVVISSVIVTFAAITVNYKIHFYSQS